MPLFRAADGQLYSGPSGSSREIIARLPTSTFRAAMLPIQSHNQTAGRLHDTPADLLTSVTGEGSSDDLEEKLCEICQHAVSIEPLCKISCRGVIENYNTRSFLIEQHILKPKLNTF
jgi:hypothetical protein